MKKLLIGIFAFFIGCISFSSAFDIPFCYNVTSTNPPYSNMRVVSNCTTGCKYGSTFVRLSTNTSDCLRYGYKYYTGDNSGSLQSLITDFYPSDYVYPGSQFSISNFLMFFPSDLDITFINPSSYNCSFTFNTCLNWDLISQPSTPSDITVYYNNGQTTNIACNGDNIITINGLSTMSSISTFTPYFNINYVDQDNQVLTESYSNNILYLSGGQYQKTYTGGSNNDWVLNLQKSQDGINIEGYTPTFDVTGNITEIDTGNVFNNFAENSLTVLLSNIPNYIQYVIMFALLLFVLGIFRRLRK